MTNDLRGLAEMWRDAQPLSTQFEAWDARKLAIGYLAQADRLAALERAVRDLMEALMAELTGFPKNAPKSAWATEWDAVEAALAAVVEKP